MARLADHQKTIPSDLPAALRDTIRAARRGCGLTQQQVAHKVGITVRSLSGWERGKAIPHLATLAALARALGQEPDWFTATAQEVMARRRAQRVGRVAAQIEGALREMERELRVTR